MALKAVLIGPSGTVFKDNHAQDHLLDQLIQFIRDMSVRGVHVGLWSRHPVKRTDPGVSETLECYLSRMSGVEVPFYQAASGALPARQKSGAVDPILAHLGVKLHETILVGNEDGDMQAGVNNKLLLVRPEWYPGSHEYGFQVSSLSELSRFCVLFGLRQFPIFWSINYKNLQVRMMGPFSTYKADYAIFGTDAKSTAKHDAGYREFWFLMIVSSLYFSGMMHGVDVITSFPGHNPALQSDVRKGLDVLLTTLGKCFRKRYMPDLLVRHQTSVKSQTASASQKTFRNQLNTLHLNRYPKLYDKPPNKSPVNLAGKTVLVVDDICTNGRSLDAARAYVEAAGGNALLFSWLKTINRAYQHMNPDPALSPFQPNNIVSEPAAQMFDYRSGVVSYNAPAEINACFEAYKTWKLPQIAI